jgi:hypothetical protein
VITVRFVEGETLVTEAIVLAEYGFWAAHVEAVMPDGTVLGAYADGGVQIRPRDYDKSKFQRELLVNIDVEDVVTDRFYAFLRKQLGKPYDVEAILAFVSGRDWQRDDSWFCSELQAAALVDCGWFAAPLATEFNHITPRDLLLILSGGVAVASDAA